MEFLDRSEESDRLDQLVSRPEGGLAVVHGRRRLGKTRLLLEWAQRHRGLYTVADQSAPEVQRRYFAQAVARALPGLDDAEYRDWRGLFSRIARDAAAAGWRGPLVIDEFPYLVLASPELPSVLQQWLDHDARTSRMVIAVAGSSQRMMQGLALARDAPLFGRAHQILEVGPLGPEWLLQALAPGDVIEAIEHWAAWGGVPRYWELAREESGPVASTVERTVLDPLGPLHAEPDRLLLEELPPAVDLRPILDAIGGGAHRLSEIGGRIGRPATSMSRPIERLLGIGLVRREVPFGEPDKGGKRALYRLADPLVRLWFRVVAPNRGWLASAVRAERLALLATLWPGLLGEAWEELVRARLGHLPPESPLGRLGPWTSGSRWWWRNEPEWDLVARSRDGRTLLVGEARFQSRPFSLSALEREAGALLARPLPLPLRGAKRVLRALCVPAVERPVSLPGVALLTADDLFGRLPPPPARRRRPA